MGFLDTLTSKLGFNDNDKKNREKQPSFLESLRTRGSQEPSGFLANLSSRRTDRSFVPVRPTPFKPEGKKVTDLDPSLNPAKQVRNPDVTFESEIIEPVAKAGRLFISRPAKALIKSFEDIGGFLGDKNYKPEPFKAETAVEKALFGEEPIDSFVGFSRQLKKDAKEIEKQVVGEDGEVFFRGINPVLASSIAFIGSFAPLADILPGGKGSSKVLKGATDDLVKLFIKSSDDASSFKILKNAGVSDDLAKEVAPLITRVKNADEAKAIMRDTVAKELQNVQAGAFSRIDELTNQQKGIQIDGAGKKIKVSPRLLSADEMDELKFLTENKSKPENILLANRAVEIASEAAAPTRVASKSTGQVFEVVNRAENSTTIKNVETGVESTIDNTRLSERFKEAKKAKASEVPKEALEQEAKKFDSAKEAVAKGMTEDEFVKGQAPTYTSMNQAERKIFNVASAEKYSFGGEKLNGFEFAKKLKDEGFVVIPETRGASIGYKAVKGSSKININGNVAKSFNALSLKTDTALSSNIKNILNPGKTTSELRTEYQTALKAKASEVPKEALEQEAKKFNSVDEFVDSQLVNFDDLEVPAKTAIQAEARVKMTNFGVSAEEANPFKTQWKKATETIENLRIRNEDVFTDTFTLRGSQTKGRIIVDKDGIVIDGNNRLREAFNRGDETIEIFEQVTIKTKAQLTDIWNKAKASEVPKVTDKERKFITSAKASEDIASDVSKEISESYTPNSNKNLVENSTARVADDFEAAKKFAKENNTDEAVATRIAVDKQLSANYKAATSKLEKDALAKELRESLVAHARLATEEGRAVQANALLGKTTPEGMLRTTSKSIDQYNATARNKIPQLTDEDVKFVLDKGNEIEGMAEGLAKEKATLDLANRLEDLIPSPMWKKIVHVYKAGLLTGLKTSGVNLQSTFWNGVAEQAKNIPATGIDLAMSVVSGERTKVLTLTGLLKGSKEGVKKGWNYLKSGVGEESAKSALEFGNITYDTKVGKALGVYADTVYRVLGAEDMPPFYGALRRSLYEQALVNIKNTKKVFKNSDEKSKFIQDFMNNPPSKALELADLDAKIATFRNDTALGIMARGIQNAPIVGLIAQMTVLPFAKTPSAVAMQLFNYTPGGLLTTFYKGFLRNGFDQKEVAEGLGRITTGMGALWLGTELYKKGKITLGYPSDEKTRNEWEATGKKENSIEIGGKYVPLITFGPQGMVLAIGGYFQTGKDDTGSISGGVIQGFFGGVKGMTEQTFLTGVKRVIDVLDDPEKKAGTYVSSQISSFVPTIVSDISKSFDEYERKSGTMLESIKGRIPGLRNTTPRRLNVWGQPIKRNRPAIATALSPVRLSNPVENPLNTETERLAMFGEDVNPTKVKPKISDVKLDDKEYYVYQRTYGALITTHLNQLIGNEGYQRLNPEQQAEKFTEVITTVKRETSKGMLPVLIKMRYDFGEEADYQNISKATSELYKKSPDFAKADYEIQAKILKSLLQL